MATSGSLEKRREKKPESVQFWLAIAAASLLFHALLIVGVKRWVNVAVVEPDAGAIDVEMVDASDFKAAPSEEPIVPAAAFKPEPFKPEPTPLPEFSPEPALVPTPEPVKPEPIVKPVVKKPIVPQLKTPPTPTSPRSSAPPSFPPTPPSTPPTLNPTRSFTVSSKSPEITSPVGALGPVGTKAFVRLKVPSSVSFPAKFSLNAGDTISFDFTFDLMENGDFAATSFEKIKINGSEVKDILKDMNDRSALLEFLDSLLSKISLEERVIENGRQDKPVTSWKAPIELRLKMPLR